MLTYVVAGFVIYLLALSMYRRRDHVRQTLRQFTAMFIAYLLTLMIANSLNASPSTAFFAAAFIGVVVGNRLRPRRTRYIPLHVRRVVIARFEAKGERYNPEEHEIDHVVPYSRGGNNTADNLKVIPKARNRSKSNRAPWWDIPGKF